jgi:hypothetical protein
VRDFGREKGVLLAKCEVEVPLDCAAKLEEMGELLEL